MPKFMDVSDTETGNSLFNFDYTSVKVDRLGATEYTAVTIVVDKTLSVSPFKKGLEDMIKTCVESCKKSPRALNLLIRIIAFNSEGIEEIHGWMLLSDIKIDDYDDVIFPANCTNLIDAALNGLAVTHDYITNLYNSERICNANGMLFFITDGDDNASKNPTENIKETIDKINQEEAMESLRTILIGVNDTNPYFQKRLETFRKEAGIDEYISMGDVTDSKLAKLAQFMSQSISAQSNSLGTGQPSQPISDYKF